ncbi:MAG: T9SS type A sorting domain-containing protein, partial [Bacteroidota bacterium]
AQYYGVRAIITDTELHAFSGYTTESDGSDASLFAGLTSRTLPAGGERDRAVVVGQGPFTLPGDGSPVTAFFALVPGESLDAMLTNAFNCAIDFCTDVETVTQAGTYRLDSVYPNPSTTTARVGFTLPAAEDATVEVFDLLGRRVATLTDGLRAAGEHTVTLDAAGLPSGVYVVRLATPSASLTERVTVVR